MKKTSIYIILINLVVILIYFNFSVVRKEKMLNNGTLILLPLAPVDPRSLFQGDYMDLRYAMSNSVSLDSIPVSGFFIVSVDSNNIASKIRVQQNSLPKSAGEYALRYQVTKSRSVKIGAESYFFQEGKAENYEAARYGGLKIDSQGNALLVGLYDEKYTLIK